MLRFLHIGYYAPDQVDVRQVGNRRWIVPEVETLIDQAWIEALKRPKVHLFDGPMCRLEGWSATDDRLALELSPSSYKPFYGTNLSHPELADRYGSAILANPVGVSPALITGDHHLMFGHRNASLAYYPGRIHPFAGALEPRDAGDVFAALRRELEEELALDASDLIDLRCTGIVEDRALRQPELIFAARTPLTCAQVESQIDAREHAGSWSIPAMPDAIAEALRSEPLLTPVARAAALLWGRIRFGQDWFDHASTCVTA